MTKLKGVVNLPNIYDSKQFVRLVVGCFFFNPISAQVGTKQIIFGVA